MSFVDPATVQDPTTDVVATHGWGDAINAAFNWLRGPKAGCSLTTIVGTATGTDTVIPFATEVYDVNACHSTVTNTSRITVPAGWGGLWLLGSQIRCSDGIFTMHLVVNATTRIVGETSSASGSVVTTAFCETIYELAAGDYVEVWVTGGTSIDTGVVSRFYGHWLHGVL